MAAGTNVAKESGWARSSATTGRFPNTNRIEATPIVTGPTRPGRTSSTRPTRNTTPKTTTGGIRAPATTTTATHTTSSARPTQNSNWRQASCSTSGSTPPSPVHSSGSSGEVAASMGKMIAPGPRRRPMAAISTR